MTFTHLDERGKARMVDITAKAVTTRTAIARATVASTKQLDREQAIACEMAARIGVQKTSSLIPLCHPIPIDTIDVEITPIDNGFHIDVTVTTDWRTGVEMEALTGAMIAALTAVRAVGAQHTTIEDVALLRKSGGRSGVWGRSTMADETTDGNATGDSPNNNQHRDGSGHIVQR